MAGKLSASKQTLRLLAIDSERFGGSLTKAENDFLGNVVAGEETTLGGSKSPEELQKIDAKSPGTDRSIRGSLIRWLCTDSAARMLVDPVGIYLSGALITDPLDLISVDVPFALIMKYCYFTKDIILTSAKIPELSLEGSWVQSIQADRVAIASSVFLRHKFRSFGQVRFVLAHIGGDLDCVDALFSKKNLPQGAPVLQIDRSIIGGSFILIDAQAEGEIRMPGAQISGDLVCEGVRLTNPGGTALRAKGVVVKGSAIFRKRCHIEGCVDFTKAQFGDLEMTGSDFKSATIVLEDSTIGSIKDDETSWPDKKHLKLNGCVYSRISPRTVSRRLEWLRLAETFSPQPYQQLAKVLQESGDEPGRIEVLTEMETQKAKGDYRPQRFLNAGIGYGYHPENAVIGLLLISAIGWTIYRRNYRNGIIVPTDKAAYEAFKADGRPPLHYPEFHPMIYSIENTFPLVKLGQVGSWNPDPSGPGSRKTKSFLRWCVWIQVILGWLLATLFVAAVSGIVRKA